MSMSPKADRNSTLGVVIRCWRRGWSRRSSPRATCGALLDSDEVDVEDEHAARRAGFTLVGQSLRNPEAGPLSFHHELHPFSPATDHIIEPQRGRFAARNGAVEHLPVGRPAG